MDMENVDLWKNFKDDQNKKLIYMRLLVITTTLFVFYSCSNEQSIKTADTQNLSIEVVKKDLLSLETKWLDYEFNLDTASIAKLLDDDFISISASDTSNKQMELEGVYKNISAMRNDSIFIDSFKIEEPFIVKQVDNTAITIFICHTYKKDKGKPVEKRTKFYDVWVNRDGEWKAVSSQATVVSN